VAEKLKKVQELKEAAKQRYNAEQKAVLRTKNKKQVEFKCHIMIVAWPLARGGCSCGCGLSNLNAARETCRSACTF
jgi:hypothetical protein